MSQSDDQERQGDTEANAKGVHDSVQSADALLSLCDSEVSLRDETLDLSHGVVMVGKCESLRNVAHLMVNHGWS